MVLNYVQIENFRSIKNLKIDLSKNCYFLVGINESGKSNVLSALSLLSKDKEPKKTDIREALPNEEPVKGDESFIRFVFEFTDDEYIQIESAFINSLFSITGEFNLLKKSKTEEIVLFKDFLRNYCEAVFRINIGKEQKFSALRSNTAGIILEKGWKKIKKGSKTPSGFEGKSFIYDTSSLQDDDWEDAKIEDILLLLRDCAISVIEENLPEVILWEYDEKNLLPSEVDLNRFATNPEICIPLKNMFKLAGVSDIDVAIATAREKSSTGLKNLLKSVAYHTTELFQNIWKEYDKVEFLLEPDGTNIRIAVSEKNSFPLAMRSDGFKRFVSFLLTVSISAKNQSLINSLLLFDEPDTGLHPSGTRYLRDELIRISKNNNYVFASTHSIFMIDNENIERHLIVKKENEVTNISIANDSNFKDEELIYRALGFSVYEVLKKKNIIFEGWKDKKLFKTALSSKSHKTQKEFFEGIGVTHAKGVSSIKMITPLMELARRECLIISDADEAAVSRQKEFQKERVYGVWKRYDELFKTVQAVTSEDFIKDEYFQKTLENLISKKGFKKKKEFSNHSKGKIFALKLWLNQNDISKDDSEEFVNEFKDTLFDELKYSDIHPDYFDFLDAIIKLLDK